jgi:hypothetical protein
VLKWEETPRILDDSYKERGGTAKVTMWPTGFSMRKK